MRSLKIITASHLKNPAQLVHEVKFVAAPVIQITIQCKDLTLGGVSLGRSQWHWIRFPDCLTIACPFRVLKCDRKTGLRVNASSSRATDMYIYIYTVLVLEANDCIHSQQLFSNISYQHSMLFLKGQLRIVPVHPSQKFLHTVHM